MTTPSDSDIIPNTGFDPITFWIENKGKVLLYGAILIIAVAAYAAYQISAQHKLQQAQQALNQASSEEDYRAIVQKFPHTVASGNASLMLAEKLRNEKKYDDAVSTLQTLIDGQPEYPLIDSAWLSLACTYEAQGKADQALNTYKQIATKFADRYSAPQALLAEAEIYKSQGKLEDAQHTYENVKTQFPASAFAGEALRKLQLLKK